MIIVFIAAERGPSKLSVLDKAGQHSYNTWGFPEIKGTILGVP